MMERTTVPRERERLSVLIADNAQLAAEVAAAF